MSDAFEQAFTIALDDLNHDRLLAPEEYLKLVPQARHEEFADRLLVAMAERGPIEGIDELSAEAHRHALAVVARVRGSAGPCGILPGALIALRQARGIDRNDLLDDVAADLAIGASGRPTLRRLYHRLESGSLLGSKVSHRLLHSIAARLGASGDDFIAAVQPTGAPTRPVTAPAMGRPGLSRRGPAPRHGNDARYVAPDPDAELVERLFCGGHDA